MYSYLQLMLTGSASWNKTVWNLSIYILRIGFATSQDQLPRSTTQCLLCPPYHPEIETLSQTYHAWLETGTCSDKNLGLLIQFSG